MENCTPLYHDSKEEKFLVNEEEEEDDEERALSLCDLPLSVYEESPRISSHFPRKSSSQPLEFFEFFSDLSSQMSSAEDIILHGKLIPFKQPNHPTPPPPSPPLPITKISKTQLVEPQKVSFCSKSTTSSESSTKSKLFMTRNSRSFSYHKLEMLSRDSLGRGGGGGGGGGGVGYLKRSSSLGSIGRSEVTMSRYGKVVTKPRWYVLMFGLVKPPNFANMELKDIKNRQSRRNPSAMFLPMDVSGEKPPAGENFGKGSCSFLRALTCKNYDSVSVASPFNMPPL